MYQRLISVRLLINSSFLSKLILFPEGTALIQLKQNVEFKVITHLECDF